MLPSDIWQRHLRHEKTRPRLLVNYACSKQTARMNSACVVRLLKYTRFELRALKPGCDCTSAVVHWPEAGFIVDVAYGIIKLLSHTACAQMVAHFCLPCTFLEHIFVLPHTNIAIEYCQQKLYLKKYFKKQLRFHQFCKVDQLQAIRGKIIFSCFMRVVHCKKSIDFTVKYLSSGCQFTCRYFNGRLLVEHF